jgi:hypothetical protein
MTPIKAILIKPLDGEPAGAHREFSKTDFDRLKALGAVRALPQKEAKAAPTPSNKMASEVANKAAPTPKNKNE